MKKFSVKERHGWGWSVIQDGGSWESYPIETAGAADRLAEMLTTRGEVDPQILETVLEEWKRETRMELDYVAMRFVCVPKRTVKR